MTLSSLEHFQSDPLDTLSEVALILSENAQSSKIRSRGSLCLAYFYEETKIIKVGRWLILQKAETNPGG